MLRCQPVLFALAALAGCGEGKAPAPVATAADPAVTGALADQIMVDPDLVGQSRADAAVAVAGPASAELPPEQTGPEAIAAAKADAARLLGGAPRPVPAPAGGGADKLLHAAAKAAQVGPGAKSGNADCASKVEYGMRWAASLPEPLAVYPRGAVQEAAGTDAGGCRLRVVHFVTPVAVDDVLAFYHARLTAAGYGAAHKAEGGAHALGGGKGAAAYVIQVRRPQGSALTEVDLVVGG